MCDLQERYFKRRLAVVGNKDFENYNFIEKHLRVITTPDLIISGGALGVDSMAIRFAEYNNIPWIYYPPDYNQFNYEAKQLRDRIIVDQCTELIAFWDGICEGTKYTINYALACGKEVCIVRI